MGEVVLGGGEKPCKKDKSRPCLIKAVETQLKGERNHDLKAVAGEPRSLIYDTIKARTEKKDGNIRGFRLRNS